METADLVNEAFDLVDEMCARELTSNCAYSKFAGMSWEDLCNKAILTIAAMKRSIPIDIEIRHEDEHYGYYDNIHSAIADLIYIEKLYN